jgi:hypothetical protein
MRSVFALELMPDALISSSTDRGLPAEYSAASILAAISVSGNDSRKLILMK